MFRLTKSFERAIRNLKSPTSAAFDQQAWSTALESCADAGEAERRLVEAAIWIGAQAALARMELTTSSLDALDAEQHTLVAIAALNREYRTVQQLIRDQLASRAHDSAILDDMSAMSVTGAAGTPVGVGDLMEASVDSTEPWLYDAERSTGPGTTNDDLTSAAIEGVRAYSWRKTLNVLWNQAQYEGAYLAVSGTNLMLLPADPALEQLITSCLGRQEMNLLNYPMLDRETWRVLSPRGRRLIGMARSVTKAERVSERTVLKVTAQSYLSKHLPAYVAEKGGLEFSYLAEFLDTPMPADPRITASLLLKTWHVVRDAAEKMSIITPLPTKLTVQKVRNLALVVEFSELRKAVQNALRLDEPTAEALFRFLIYRTKIGGMKGHRGLWSAPVVPVPGGSQVALALPALATSNPLRRLEGWLEKGGIDDTNPISPRGGSYEVSYRSSICEGIERNKIFKTARCLQRSIKKSTSFNEEVDLLFSFGGLAVVGEIKFFLTPADPHERSRYFNKLEDAANQVSRKSRALSGRRDVIAAALEIPCAEAEALDIIPVVVTNQGFAFSHEISGVRIVDAYFMKTFLSGDMLVSGMAFDSKSNRSEQMSHQYYATEREARQRFEVEIKRPFVLDRFLRRASFRFTALPMLDGPPLQVAGAFLGETRGVDRLRAEALMARVKGG